MVDIVIPIHNLKRNPNRVYFSLYSLSTQNVNKVYISDSSDEGRHEALRTLCKPFKFVEWIHCPDSEFNKPRLYNKALKRSTSEYIMFTDCDYIFSKDFLSICEQERTEKTMLLKAVKSLPNVNMSIQRINAWNFPSMHDYTYINKDGENLANGACQYALTSWFKEVGGYDERMAGFGGMDNLMVNKAKYGGLKIKWVKGGQILHQFHRPEKFATKQMEKQFAINQKILHSETRKLRNEQESIH